MHWFIILCGLKSARLATVSVLLFETEEYFHSTSHYSPLGIPLLYELLLSKQEDLCATSHVEPAVNRQPVFRRELVEHITSFMNHS